MRTFVATLFLLGFSWFTTACTNMAARHDARPGAPADGAAAGFVSEDELVSRSAVAGGRSAAASPKANDRLLIQRGELQIEAARPEDAMAALLAATRERGGHLQSQIGTRLVVRVPAAAFDELFAFTRTLGRVLAESREANDVTDEFLDLEIRLDNARKARERLTEVLQKATTVEDILRVEAELRRLTEEIERMEGRRKVLREQVAMATLTAVFDATRPPPPPPRRQKQPSRYEWINRVGVESMRRDF
jgi:hypothetical protein